MKWCGEGDYTLPDSSDSNLHSVDRALALLSAFSEREEYGVAELGTRLGIAKSVVHRLLLTLTSRGFVEKTEGRRYRLGIRILELGNAYRMRMDLVRTGEALLHRFSRECDANVHLAKLDSEHAEVIDLVRVEFPYPVRVAKFPILRRPATCTALGKVLIAFGQPQDFESAVASGLRKMGPNSITKPAALRAELDRISERGWGVDDEEFSAGIRCVAAPVFDETGRAVAAVSVSGLITHITKDRIDHYAQLTVNMAQQLSTRIGWAPTAARDLGGGI